MTRGKSLLCVKKYRGPRSGALYSLPQAYPREESVAVTSVEWEEVVAKTLVNALAEQLEDVSGLLPVVPPTHISDATRQDIG